MPTKAEPLWLTAEVADFLASSPSPEAMLAYRPSRKAQERLTRLRAKSKAGRLTEDEEHELNQYDHIEMLIQMVKARLRAPRGASS
jgi:hypothetical protein